jgi:uncharacterized membrane protein
MMTFGGTVMLVYGVSWVFIVAGLGFLLYALFVRGAEGGAAQRLTSAVDPLTLLKSRYARGEITRDQFLAMQRDLGDMGGIRE